MSKCKDCKYAYDGNYKIRDIECCTCSLTRRVMNANAESECNCYNRDLSQYDICYNCKYYIGGGDWGLFCSHSDMYHHLGKFSDEPCERYERRQPTVTINDTADEIKVTNCNHNADPDKKASFSRGHENGKDVIYRQDVTELWDKYHPYIATKAMEYDRELRALPPARSEVETQMSLADCISREDALSCFHDWIDSHGDVHTADEMPEYQRIEELPSAQPKRTDKRTETHACENTCEIERKSNDMISRQDAIELAMQYCPDDDGTCSKADEDIRNLLDELEGLPPVQPERPEQPESAKEYCAECDHIEMCQWYPYEGCEFRSLPPAQPEEFEWCRDCKEYDQTAHCCHRWTKVIRQTVEELKAEQPARDSGQWIYGEHDTAMCDGYRCDKCGFFVPWDYKFTFIDFINDYHFCPGCGARMVKEGEEHV